MIGQFFLPIAICGPGLSLESAFDAASKVAEKWLGGLGTPVIDGNTELRFTSVRRHLGRYPKNPQRLKAMVEVKRSDELSAELLDTRSLVYHFELWGGLP